MGSSRTEWSRQRKSCWAGRKACRCPRRMCTSCIASRQGSKHLECVLAFSWYKAGCECTVKFSNQKGGPLWQELPHQVAEPRRRGERRYPGHVPRLRPGSGRRTKRRTSSCKNLLVRKRLRKKETCCELPRVDTCRNRNSIEIQHPSHSLTIVFVAQTTNCKPSAMVCAFSRLNGGVPNFLVLRS